MAGFLRRCAFGRSAPLQITEVRKTAALARSVNGLLTLTKPNDASGAEIPFRLTFALTPILSHAIPNHPVEFSAAEYRHRPHGGDGKAVARKFDLEWFG